MKRKILLVYFVAVLATAVASADKQAPKDFTPGAKIGTVPFMAAVVPGHSDLAPTQGGSVAQVRIPTKSVTTLLVSAFPGVIREENSLILAGLAFFSIGFLGLRRAQRAATS